MVEHQHAKLNHYFMTAFDSEKAKLDSGQTQGWARMGFAFTAYAAGANAPNTTPVCRFYGGPEAGLDSHFYLASPSECAEIAAKFATAWVREADNVFEVIKLEPGTGLCAAAGAPIYRAYNGHPDANHRYSPHAVDQMAMQDKGWTPEGDSAAGMVMCVPVSYRP